MIERAKSIIGHVENYFRERRIQHLVEETMAGRFIFEIPNEASDDHYYLFMHPKLTVDPKNTLTWFPSFGKCCVEVTDSDGTFKGFFTAIGYFVDEYTHQQVRARIKELEGPENLDADWTLHFVEP